jgi:MFS family permease
VTGAFRRLQVSSVIANFADGMSLVAFPLLAAAFTTSPLVIAGISAARSLPWLLASLHIGALIDRRWPDRLLILANAVRVVLFVLLALLLLLPANLFVGFLAVAAFGAGVLEVAADNSTQTLIPKLVRPQELPAANARIQLIENVGLNLAGAPVASALLSLNLALPLLFIAAKYSAATALLRGLRTGGKAGERHAKAMALLSGWRHIRGSRALFTLASTTALSNLPLAGAEAILVVYVKRQLHAPSWSYGLLLAALAAGTILGAWMTPRALARAGEPATLRAPLIAMPVAMLVLAIATDFWLAVIAQVALGVLQIAWGIVTVSFRQEVVPAELLGRVNAVYRMMAWGTIPIGGLLAGAMAETMGIRGAYLSLAAILLAGWPIAAAIRPDVLDRERPLARRLESEGAA